MFKRILLKYTMLLPTACATKLPVFFLAHDLYLPHAQKYCSEGGKVTQCLWVRVFLLLPVEEQYSSGHASLVIDFCISGPSTGNCNYKNNYQ